ncbi:uncharacterized protein I-3 [Drosophila takahashii]|uniref:uncharacterized protein I-3 n=1 Tax=Drosophila takahashii TaxID=29030 RepID=UPI001CF8B1F4|nr:type 1 phosphatases regulator ypi1 [Drosophila takahashii]
MDQPKAMLSTIDGETTENRGSMKVTTTDSGFNSADSTDSADQVALATPPSLLRLRLAAQSEQPTMTTPSRRRVGFHAGVIDNEHMNRRKSKCCCIYRRPHPFGESSSSTDDECDNCFGHPEVRTRNRLEKLEKRRQAEQNCGCGCHCHHHRTHRHINRNNRLPIGEIAAEKDNNRDEEEPKAVIKNRNKSTGEIEKV